MDRPLAIYMAFLGSLILVLFLTINGFSSTEKMNSNEGMADEGIPDKMEVATLAGGCFWCMETPFEKLPGVSASISGYTGGHKKNPTYKEVSHGTTGHVEAVQVFFDPEKISYADILDVFWRNIDPTDKGGQFVDRGEQYTTGIYYHNEAQKIIAEQSKKNLMAIGVFNKSIVTPIKKMSKFYRAEEYHQDYHKKNSVRYNLYRLGSGRDQFIDKYWGENRHYNPIQLSPSDKGYSKPSANVIKKKLTRLQYRVTQRNGTEPPFTNKFWDNKKAGIYVDVVSGEPLFSSQDKFKSGTGWPSFTRPLKKEHIKIKTDSSFGMMRTEVRSRYGDSHLGHVFRDGPAPTGLRYCINSASLRFIPADKLELEGYAEFEANFKNF